jgi:hypothetical protein
MAQEKKEILIAPGADVFVADVGTAFPKEPTESAGAGWTELGYISEDGAKFNISKTVKDVKAAQKRLAVRRTVTDEDVLTSFSLLQFNAENWAFAFGGGEFEEVKTGVFRYDFPGGDEALNEKALLLRWVDGDRHFELGIEVGNVTEGVEVGLKRADESMIPISFKALGAEGADTVGVHFQTDDEAFEPVGS